MKRIGPISKLAAGTLGLLAGLGVFTFHYAEGFSYFSHDPAACNNCHVMNDFYDGWQKSSHHVACGCVECHMPEGLVDKVIAKTDNGYRHSKGFTFMDFHDPIQIKPRNSEILQANCVRCHGDFVHDALISDPRPAKTGRCVHCHRAVGHGARG